MKSSQPYIIVILLLSIALMIKTCSKNNNQIKQPMSGYIDSLEIANNNLKDSIKINDGIILKLKQDSQGIKVRLRNIKGNLERAKINFKAALDVIDFISVDSNVLYLRKSVGDEDIKLLKDSTVSIKAKDLKIINKSFVSTEYLKALNDSLETEVWVSYTQHVVDDQIIKLQDSDIKELHVMIDNKDKITRSLVAEVTQLTTDNHKLKRRNRIKNAITITSVAIATTSVLIISYLVK